MTAPLPEWRQEAHMSKPGGEWETRCRARRRLGLLRTDPGRPGGGALPLPHWPVALPLELPPRIADEARPTDRPPGDVMECDQGLLSGALAHRAPHPGVEVGRRVHALPASLLI